MHYSDPVCENQSYPHIKNCKILRHTCKSYQVNVHKFTASVRDKATEITKIHRHSNEKNILT